MSYELVVKGGLLVTAEETRVADVAIVGERIAAVGTDLEGARELDAHGLYVLPGAIDGHVHFDDPTFPPFATGTADTFASGTIAAAHGGVTTVIDFAQPAIGKPLLEELARRRSDADGVAAIDYALHLNLRDPDPARLAEIPTLFARGVPSFKLYFAYEGYRMPDVAIFRAMEAVAAQGGLAVVHAENDDIIVELATRFAAEGKTGPRWLAARCPAPAEAEAVHRAIVMAEVASARLLVFHISCDGAAQEIARAKQRGQAVSGEVTSHGLTIDSSALAADDLVAESLAVRPPLRDLEEQQALWSALIDGTIDIVSTDHCPRLPRDGAHPAGVSGVEVRLALVHTFGVVAGRIDLSRWVDACCTRPAEIFGLDRKGKLEPGFDADVVLFDPAKNVTLSADTLHSPLGFSSYEGVQVQGVPVTTISRGEVVVEDGRFLGIPGRGRFVERGV
ncbi:MAG: dihydropyrimidinase [Gaiellaceae bacterium]